MKALVAAILGLSLSGCGDHPGSRLSEAVERGQVQEVQQMLADGTGDVDEALVWAARSGNAAVIPLLVNAGANANGTSGVNGWTVLMHAIHKGQIESVRALVAAGANPDRRGGQGGTPLTMAAGYGYSGIVKTLLDHGADPAAENAAGLTALDLAVTGVSDIDRWTVGRCQADTVRVLLDKAPQLAARDTVWRRIAGWFGVCADVQMMLQATGRKPPAQRRM